MLSGDNLSLTLTHNTLALTYDDGPGPRTLEIAEFLHAQGIRATFFVVGKYVRQNRDIVSNVAKMGHLIANHTENHLTLPDLVSEPNELIREVMSVDHQIQEFVGNGPFLLRAPGGGWSTAVAQILNQNIELHKYQGPINWEIEYGDHEVGSPRNLKPGNPLYTLERCQDSYIQGIREKNSGVVLLHDWSADPGGRGEELRRNNRTLELTKWLIPQLNDFRFLALDEIEALHV